uniref:H15 domain-containing protein n=1 Tax=Pseudonaja textilis TaxID=8673 RepID=A0A670ZDM9_PSETE
MEPNEFLDYSTLDITDDVAENPDNEDADEGPDSQDIPGCSEAADAQDPLLNDGGNNSEKKATLPSLRSGRQLKIPRPDVSKPPTSSISVLIYNAIASCQKKSGISTQALKKIVTSKGYDMVKKKHYFLRALKNLVGKGQIWQIRGTGATGSFKINPDFGKKNPPKSKGKGPKTKHSVKNKKRSAMSKNGRQAGKKQAKADVKKTCKRGKASSVQASTSQVQV